MSRHIIIYRLHTLCHIILLYCMPALLTVGKQMLVRFSKVYKIAPIIFLSFPIESNLTIYKARRYMYIYIYLLPFT